MAHSTLEASLKAFFEEEYWLLSEDRFFAFRAEASDSFELIRHMPPISI